MTRQVFDIDTFGDVEREFRQSYKEIGRLAREDLRLYERINARTGATGLETAFGETPTGAITDHTHSASGDGGHLVLGLTETVNGADGSILYTDANGVVQQLPPPGAAGYVLVSTATTQAWDQTPTLTGDWTWDDGSADSPNLIFVTGSNDDTARFFLADFAAPGSSDMVLELADAAGSSLLKIRDSGSNDRWSIGSTGAVQRLGTTGNNSTTFPDDVANAMHLVDAGGIEYLRFATFNVQPAITFNDAGADVDFYVEAFGVADALFVQGADGEITLGALGLGFVKSTAGGVLSSAAIGAGDLPAHTHSGVGQGGSLAVGTTDTDLTAGSVFFAGVAGVIQEDNANFFWDDASNELGIGTNAPGGKFHVSHTANPNITLENTGDTTAARGVSVSFHHSNNVGARIQAVRASGDSDGMFLSFSTEAVGGALAERMRITQAGLVGINTTGPDRRLDVLDASNPQLRLTHTDGTVYTDFQTTASGYLYINPSADRTGFRTSTPSYIVHVPWQSGDAVGTSWFGSQNAANNQIAVEAHSYSVAGVRATSETGDAVSGSAPQGRGGVFVATSGTGLHCQATTGIGFRADLAGLGTAIAQFRDNGNVVFEIVDGGNAISTVPTGTAMTINLTGAGTAILDCQDNGTTAFLVDDGGNVGVGSSAAPSQKLHVYDASSSVNVRVETDLVNGFAQVQLLNDARQWGVGVNGADNFQIRDETATANRLHINSSGHVYPGANKTQDLGLTGARWNTLYQGTSTAAGTSRTFESTRDCPVCQTTMIRGTGSLCILGEDRDYEVAHCPNCGTMATEEIKHLPPARLTERLQPPKVEFLGMHVFPMSGNSRKVRVDFRYVNATDDDESDVTNATYLGETELADLLTMSESERQAFLLELGQREWDAMEEVRLQKEEVATLQGTLDALAAPFIGADLLRA